VIFDSRDRLAVGDGTYQLLEVRRCAGCGRDTPHEFTDTYLRCVLCRRMET
jgi:hypothetical protein